MAHVIQRATSRDRQRWAYSRFYKSKPGRKAGVFWTLKTREPDGTVIVLARGMTETEARQWVRSHDPV